jgi:hypothetical protein
MCRILVIDRVPITSVLLCVIINKMLVSTQLHVDFIVKERAIGIRLHNIGFPYECLRYDWISEPVFSTINNNLSDKSEDYRSLSFPVTRKLISYILNL